MNSLRSLLASSLLVLPLSAQAVFVAGPGDNLQILIEGRKNRLADSSDLYRLAAFACALGEF